MGFDFKRVNLCLLIILCMSCVSFAQEQQKSPAYFLPTPSGWKTESFEFPLGFAPDIKYTGVEDIRFSQGWSDQKSDNFFSYLFIWYVNEYPALTEQKLQDYMKLYFDGLAKTVAESNNIPAKDVSPTMALFVKDKNKFRGKINFFDSFFSKQQLILNVLAETTECKEKKKHVIFFQLSPQNTNHKIWNDLKTITKGFRCK